MLESDNLINTEPQARVENRDIIYLVNFASDRQLSFVSFYGHVEPLTKRPSGIRSYLISDLFLYLRINSRGAMAI